VPHLETRLLTHGFWGHLQSAMVQTIALIENKCWILLHFNCYTFKLLHILIVTHLNCNIYQQWHIATISNSTGLIWKVPTSCFLTHLGVWVPFWTLSLTPHNLNSCMRVIIHWTRSLSLTSLCRETL
jgi:hypothetical protein